MKRVLHIISGFGGGVSSFVRNIVIGSKSHEIINDVAGFTSFPDFYITDVNQKGGDVYTLVRVRPMTVIESILQLKGIVGKNKYEAVHLHITDLPALYFWFFLKCFGVRRIILHAHITDHQDNKGFVKHVKYSFYRMLNSAIASQMASCSKMASAFRFGQKYVDNNKVMHVPNSINVSKYKFDITEEKKCEYRREFDIPDNAIVVGHVGYFGYQKNHRFMLEIIERMKKRGINAVWLFVGIGEYFDDIQELVKQKGIGNYVRFLKRRNDVNELFEFMDVSILPSYFEGLPTVAIECQAAGTPLLVSDSVSPELDMGLGIVKFLSLNEQLDVWVDALIKLSNIVHVPSEIRCNKIKERYFTAEGAAHLYTLFINNEITYYNLHDKI